MRRLFGCPDIVSLTEKFLMARNFYRIFTENNPVMGESKTFGIPEAKGLKIQHDFQTFKIICGKNHSLERGSYFQNSLQILHVNNLTVRLYAVQSI